MTDPRGVLARPSVRAAMREHARKVSELVSHLAREHPDAKAPDGDTWESWHGWTALTRAHDEAHASETTP